MDLRQLVRAFDGGRIDVETLVWRKGMPDWRRVRDVPELADKLLGEAPRDAPSSLDYAAPPTAPVAKEPPARRTARSKQPPLNASDMSARMRPASDEIPAQKPSSIIVRPGDLAEPPRFDRWRVFIVIGALAAGALLVTLGEWPELTVQRIPYLPGQHSLRDVDEVMAELDWFSVGFTGPRSIEYRGSDLVEVDLTAVAEPGLDASEQVSSEFSTALQLSNRVKAELVGPGFAVAQLTPADQFITSRQPARWQWRVTALEDGPQTLHLSLSAFITVAGQESAVVRTLEKRIDVRSGLVHRSMAFAATHWQWALTTLLVPMGTWLWRLREGIRPKRTPRMRFWARRRGNVHST